MFIQAARSSAIRSFCLASALALAPALALAQNNEAPPEQQAGETKKADEFAEAASAVEGAAGHPECVWLGRRIVNLLWRDDLDTAFRHFDLYDRFGCPGGHVQMTFRCVVRQGSIDPKAPESLALRVHQCWLTPDAPAQTAAAPETPPAQPEAPPAKPEGTQAQ